MRPSEIEAKFTHPDQFEKKRGETRGWFQTLKRHSELDPEYSQRLDDHLSQVTDALGGENGIWDSSQEVLGESHHGRIEPKMLDVPKIAAIRSRLDELIRFLASERTPGVGPSPPGSGPGRRRWERSGRRSWRSR